MVGSYREISTKDTKLREYQQEAKDDIFASWDQVDNVMFQMPTGTGKTRLFTSLIKDIRLHSVSKGYVAKILIIAHRTELIDQISKSLLKYEVSHGIIAGKFKDKRDPSMPVQVASIQTITNKYNQELAASLKIDYIVIDEAHHSLADSYKKLWKLYPKAKFLGVTATPWRMSHAGFTSLYNKLILSKPIKYFIENNYLSAYQYYSIPRYGMIQRRIDNIHKFDKYGDYEVDALEETMDTDGIRAQLLNSYLSLAKGKKGIIYAITRAHSYNICAQYRKAGIRIESIDSNTPAKERENIVDNFRKGKLDIIVNVDIFSEGFDCPDIEFIQLARPTRSLVKYLQQVGRGLRPHDDKERALILDNVGMYKRFGLPDANRHWKAHFIGEDVDESPKLSYGDGSGWGNYREPDLSEGNENMVLVQQVDSPKPEPKEEPKTKEEEIMEFFPVNDIVLGETTILELKGRGWEVNRGRKDQWAYHDGVSYMDMKNTGKVQAIHIIKYCNMFEKWEKMGLTWDLSYRELIRFFESRQFTMEVLEEPSKKMVNKMNTLYARVSFTSQLESVVFTLDFSNGKNGCQETSPNTLFAIDVQTLAEPPAYFDYLMFSEDVKTVLKCKKDHEGEVEIPDGVETIAEKALKGCKKITKVLLPETLKEIGQNAFQDCSLLTQIDLPENLQSIGNDAFNDAGLAEVLIPANVHKIGYTAFNCPIKVNAGNPDFSSKDGVLYSHDQDGLLLYPKNKKDSKLRIAGTVQYIDSWAFQDSNNLEMISIPSSITEYGREIFSGCDSLNTLIWNASDLKKLVLDDDVFLDFDQSHCILSVPFGTSQMFKEHELFADFVIEEQGCFGSGKEEDVQLTEQEKEGIVDQYLYLGKSIQDLQKEYSQEEGTILQVLYDAGLLSSKDNPYYQTFLAQLDKMNSANSDLLEKYVLLLALIEQMERVKDHPNKFEIGSVLLERYKRLWNLLTKNRTFAPILVQASNKLAEEPFWTMDGQAGVLDPRVFIIMKDSNCRSEIRSLLLSFIREIPEEKKPVIPAKNKVEEKPQVKVAVPDQKPVSERVIKLLKPARDHESWSTVEVNELKEEYFNKKSIEEIARIHQRTNGSIIARLELLNILTFDDNEPLQDFLSQLRTMNRNKQEGLYAPHKPVLLLAVLDLIECGKITKQEIENNEDLSKGFRKNWNLYVPMNTPFSPNITNPFYYLKSEPFWDLIDSKHAKIGTIAFSLMRKIKWRREMKKVLIDMIYSGCKKG